MKLLGAPRQPPADREQEGRAPPAPAPPEARRLGGHLGDLMCPSRTQTPDARSSPAGFRESARLCASARWVSPGVCLLLTVPFQEGQPVAGWAVSCWEAGQRLTESPLALRWLLMSKLSCFPWLVYSGFRLRAVRLFRCGPCPSLESTLN